MNSDIVIQSREKLAHGMRRRGKLGHDGDEALPQKMNELGLAARKPRQFVESPDRSLVHCMTQLSVLVQSGQITAKRIRGTGREYKCVLDAEIHTARTHRRMDMSRVAADCNAAHGFPGGHTIGDMEG
jgi:hypothetical protein